MRDLTGAPVDEVAAERERVATEGIGCRLLGLQGADGQWGGAAWNRGWNSTSPDAAGKLTAGIVAFGAGGNAGAALTRDGGLWSCGTVLGQLGAKYRFLRLAEARCWRAGWKVQWADHVHPTRIVQKQPRQLRNLDPND